MRALWQKIRGASDLTIDKDRFGYSVETKPRFPLLGFLDPVVSKIPVPADQQKELEELSKRGTVIYALKYRSQLDFLFLGLRLYQLGLPTPTFLFDVHPYAWQPKWYSLKLLVYHFIHLIRNGSLPDPYAGGYYADKVRSEEPGLLYLLGEKGYYRRTVLVGNDTIEHLVDIQRTTDRPVFIVPLVLLYTRNPGRPRRGMLEIFLGPREQPGFVRKLFSLLVGYSHPALEMGEPVNLQEVLPELSENTSERRKQIFQIRRTLIESVDELRQAIIGPTLKSKLELKEIILNNPRLESFMARRAKSSKKQVWQVRKEADGYLDEIAASYNYTLIEMAEQVLTWIWGTLFDGIEVDDESLQKVKKAARQNTLVYIPCHKSHTDYLLLSYILFKNNLYTPFIAAGKNLAFWPLGALFRGCGAFFIRRSFKGMKFYAEVFSLYVKTMVQLGYNIEFFIEGGRSRTGKMVLPKLGLLALLIQAVEEGYRDDLVFVPTSICYDRIPEEESYIKEVTGGSKVDENIGQLVQARRILKKRYGRVYVQFGEPLSLREYLERHHGGLAKLTSKQRHAMYRDFGYRVINSINESSLVSPHALVASALLATSRHGISLAEFHNVCRIFHDFLVARDIRLSKTLRNYDTTIEETLRDLERSKLIAKLKDEDDDLEEEVFTIEDNKRLALEYYKNNLIHFLLPAAFVSTSILAQQTFRFSMEQVLEDVAFLKDFFKFEFVYDNELGNDRLVREVLDAFVELEWLHPMGEGDQPYILAHKGLRAAHTFHSLLRNYLEGYWLVLRAFRYLQKRPYTEKDFTKKILTMGQKALKTDLIERSESISKIMFGNALKYYVEKGLIEKKADAEKKGGEDDEFLRDIGNRPLIQHYSRQISRLLRSPHFALQ